MFIILLSHVKKRKLRQKPRVQGHPAGKGRARPSGLLDSRFGLRCLFTSASSSVKWAFVIPGNCVSKSVPQFSVPTGTWPIMRSLAPSPSAQGVSAALSGFPEARVGPGDSKIAVFYFACQPSIPNESGLLSFFLFLPPAIYSRPALAGSSVPGTCVSRPGWRCPRSSLCSRVCGITCLWLSGLDCALRDRCLVITRLPPTAGHWQAPPVFRGHLSGVLKSETYSFYMQETGGES